MTLSLRSDISVAETGTGLVLLDERAGTYYQMNAAGALVFRRLLDGLGEAAVVDAFRERYDVTKDRAAADVTALVQRLCATGLLVERRA